MKWKIYMKFTKRTELQKYFNNIVNNNCDEIIKICTLGSASSNTVSPIKYSLDDTLYIIFRNYYALIIEYYDVCDISVEYRKLTMDEKMKIAKGTCKDLFNCVYDVYNIHTLELSKRITLNMNYAKLAKIKVKHFTGNYDTWEKGEIVSKLGTKENFDEIIFIMENNNTIHIKPEDAEADGYLDVWSKENYENITNYSAV